MRKIVAVLLVLLVGTLAGCGAEMQKDGMTAAATQKQQEDNREARQVQRDPGYITSEDELKGQKNHIQKTDQSPAIIVDEVREVIPGALVVTKTVSAYAHGQHLVQVEGRFKRTEGDLYLALLDDGGRQLGSGGLHRSDQVREIGGEWSFFSHKLVEDTGKIVDIDKGSIVFHLRREGQDKKGLLDIPMKRPQGVVASPGDKPVKVPPTEEWQVVSRAYRVQGTILKLAMTEDELETIVLEVTKNIELPNNPVVADFTGQILGIVYNQKLSEAGSLRSKLTKGSQIGVTCAQYAVPPEGRVVLGAKFDGTYYEENGKYYDFWGKEVNDINNPGSPADTAGRSSASEIPVLKMKFSVDFGMEADLLVDGLTDKNITYRYFNYQHKSGPEQPRTVPFEEMLKTEEGIRVYKVHMFLAYKGNWAELKLSPDFIEQLENSPDFRQRLGLMLNKPFNKELKGMALSPQDITINPADIVMEVASPTKKVSAFAVKITEYKTDVYLKRDGKKDLILTVVPKISKIEWSPDGNYLLVSKITGSEFGSADIYSMEDKSTIPVSFNGGPFWSPDCKKLAISLFGASIPSRDYPTLDAVIFDIKKRTYERFAKGNAEFYYTVDGWKSDGRIKYTKRSNSNGAIIEKLCYDPLISAIPNSK